MQDYMKLDVWRKAHAFALELYEATRKFPSSEKHGLAIQLRRSALSVPCNIAEGCGRASDPTFASFLDIACGSLNEAEYQLLVAHDLDYLTGADYERLNKQLAEVARMLTGLRRTVRRRVAIRENGPVRRSASSA